jgi:hypothetical protein
MFLRSRAHPLLGWHLPLNLHPTLGLTSGNHSHATSAPISPGRYVGLQCTGENWFQITLSTWGSIDVGIEFRHGEGDLDLYLYNLYNQGTGYLSHSDGSTDGEHVSGRGLSPGRYFVKVAGYNGARAVYTMTVSTTECRVATDRSTTNNDGASATAIQAGNYPGLRCTGEKWFKITLQHTGSIGVTIDFRNAHGDLDLYLYDWAENELARSDGTTDRESVSKPGLAPGTYKVKVMGYNGAVGDYNMSVVTAAEGAGVATRTGTITASSLNVRTGPGTTYPVVRVLTLGTVVTILGESGTWYRITWSGAPAGNLYASKTYIHPN